MSYRLPLDRPAVMGVLNVTPDSFSDGGQFLQEDKAVARAEQMLAEGADIIDVGGESTRPGAVHVSAKDESERVLCVIKRLVKMGAIISVDTSKSAVARDALQVGAQIVNDVTAFGDPEMARVCAVARCKVCLMHMQGNPRTMQSSPDYDNVVEYVKTYLLKKVSQAEEQGIRREDIWIDPGIGFGKTIAQNLALINHLDKIVQLGYPVLVGVSNKSFIGKILGTEEDPLPIEERKDATIALQLVAHQRGVRIIRTHYVKETVHAMKALLAVTREG